MYIKPILTLRPNDAARGASSTDLEPRRQKHKIPISVLVCEGDVTDRVAMALEFEAAHIANTLRFVDSEAQLLDYLHQRGEFGGETGKAPRPGLILLDLQQPRQNGCAVLKAIRYDQNLRSIPVIGLSSSTLDEDVIRSHDLGVHAFIRKPLTFLALFEALSTLGRHWLQIVEPPHPAL